MKLSDIYPYIFDISFEYAELFHVDSLLSEIRADISPKEISNQYELRVKIVREPRTFPQSEKIRKDNYKILSNLKFDRNTNNAFVAKIHAISQVEAISKSLNLTPFSLIYSHSAEQQVTPISRSSILLPEELPILLAFYHLSNVVRYDPLRLKRLFDSSAVGLLQALARHATFRYLILFWSYVNQRCFFFVNG